MVTGASEGNLAMETEDYRGGVEFGRGSM